MRRYGHARYADGELGWNRTRSSSIRCESRAITVMNWDGTHAMRTLLTEYENGSSQNLKRFPTLREGTKSWSRKSPNRGQGGGQFVKKLNLVSGLEPAGIKLCELKRALYRPRQGRCGTGALEASVRGLRPYYS